MRGTIMAARRTTCERRVRRSASRQIPTAGLALCALLVADGCGDSIAPLRRPYADQLLLPALNGAAAGVVDLNRRAVVRQFGPALTSQGKSVLSPDGSMLVTAGTDPAGEVLVLGLDLASSTERWRKVIANSSGPVSFDGLIAGTEGLAVHPTRPDVYLFRSRLNGQPGVAIFNYITGEFTGFVGPLVTRPGGVSMLPPGSRFPKGALLVFGDNGPSNNARAHLYAFTGSPPALTDSLVFPSPSHRVLQVEPLDGGNALLVGTDVRLLRVDVATWRIAVSAVRPSTGLVARSPADGRYFIPAPGAVDLPTPGLIHVLQPSLELLGVVDLHALPRADRPLGLTGGVVSRDGRWYFLAAGVPLDGPLYGPEPVRIFVIDTRTLTLADTIRLHRYSGAAPMLLP